jgi:hypothetical protein
LRDHLRQLAAAGFAVDDIRLGKHAKLRVTDPRGRPQLIIVGQTPSDHRASRNFAALLRRFARRDSALRMEREMRPGGVAGFLRARGQPKRTRFRGKRSMLATDHGHL